MRIAAYCFVTCFLTLGVCDAEDWPQWLGTNRDSVWNESGIVDQIPGDGLPVKWRVPVAWGYAGPAVADGKVYLMDYVHETGDVTNSPGGRDELIGKERLLCLNADSGEVIWKYEYERPYRLAYPRGPRCTPTVQEGRVYVLGAEGNLSCLDATSGEVVWTKDLPKTYRTETPIWGYAGHPLVDEQYVYCIVGGEGSLAVAFDRESGKEAWRSMSGKPSYGPPTLLEWNGKKRLFVWDAQNISSLDPKTGEVAWSMSLPPGFGVTTAAPRPLGDNIFVTAAGNVSALINVETGQAIWKGSSSTSLGCSISTPLIVDEVVYGIDGGAGALIAAQLSDGERLWQSAKPIDADSTRERGPRHGTAFLVKNRNQYFLFNDSGDLILASLTPEGYQEAGRFHVLDPTNDGGGRKIVWSHPAFAQKCLFARNDEELVCVSLAKE